LNIDVVQTYLLRKTRYIARYAKIILKSVYKAQSDNTETIEKCVSKYFDYFVLYNEVDKDIQEKSDEFCANNSIENEYNKKIIYVIFESIPHLQTITINDEYKKTILLLSKILIAAIKLEEYTTSIVNPNINFNEAISKLSKEEGLFSGKELWNDVQKVKKELKESVDDNIKSNKKLLSLFKEDPFYLDYYQVYDTKDNANIYIEVELGYDKDFLSQFDPKVVKETYANSGVLNEHFMIGLDKLLLLIFKGTINDLNYSQFIIGMPKEFLKKKTSLKKLLNITNISYLKKRISLRIDGDQLDKYDEQIKQLKESGYNIALDDIPYLNDNIGKVRLFANYLYVDKEVLIKKHEILPISEDMGIKLIDKKDSKDAVFIDL
jgi:hypothetical protein